MVSLRQQVSICAWCLALTLGPGTLLAQKAGGEPRKAAGAPPLVSRSPEALLQKYFRELRARHLYSVAEQACQYRLERVRLGRVERADLTIELASTLVEHASYVSETQQAEMWARAAQVLQELLAKDPENPRRVLLEAHAAIIPAAAGHWYRWQAELLPWEKEPAELARTNLSSALPKLLAIEKRLSSQLRSARPEVGPDDPKGFELRALLANVMQHRARAEIDLGLLPDTAAADRASSLVRAEKLLRTLVETNEGDDLIWNSRVLLVQCQRLLGDLAQAARSLAAYEALQPPLHVADRFAAESVRLLQADRKTQAARDKLDGAIAALQIPSGELGLLKAQQLADEIRAAAGKKSSDVSQSLSTLATHIATMQRDIAGYWTYRAALVEQQLKEELQYGPEVAPHVRRAETEFRHGQIAPCLAAYSTAISVAEKAGRADLAFDLSYTKASVAVQSSLWPEAAATLQASLAKTKSDKAPEAHLLYAYVLGKLFDEKPTQSRREQYTAALEEHRTRYAMHPTAVDATWMLAELEERRLQITSALKLYSQIPADHPRGTEARLRQARCYPRILDRLKELQKSTTAWETEAVTRLRELLPKTPGSALTLSETEIAIILSQILLERQPTDFESAETLLQQVFGSLAPLPATPDDEAQRTARQQLQARAMRLRVLSLAGQGRPQAAAAILEKLSATEPLELLRILESLTPLAARAAPSVQDDLAQLQLRASQKLAEQRATLQPADQHRLDLCLAQAYVASKRFSDALALYTDLIKAAPQDISLQKLSGEVLLQSGTVENAESALILWRGLEAKTKPGTDDWFTLRLNVCRALYHSRQLPQCRQHIQLTKLLYPTLGGAEMAKKFATLEEKCAQ